MRAKLILLTTLQCALAFAGPSRPVTSDTFQTQSPCGPLWDSMAVQGQWFLDPTSGTTNACTREYHDNDNSLTIAGVVQSITTNALGNITGFAILATVSNSLPADYSGGSVTNSHGEVQAASGVTSGEDLMQQVRITAEFALADTNMVPAGSAPPYWPDPGSGGTYYIVAANEDERAWYCWTPGQQQPYQPAGQFQVPSWKLVPFDIPAGGQSTVLMQFTVTGSGMPISDYRHSVIRASQQMGMDVLYNRHTSLKISHWLDTLLIDNGSYISTPLPPFWTGEEIEYIYASDASVFYNDEEDVVSHKMHYPQLPDPNGWDVRACNWEVQSGGDGKTKILADDFLCTASGPITNIIFWGSWFYDEFDVADPYQGITNIHLSIHNDIPDPDDEGPLFSMPELPALQEWNLDPHNPPAGWSVTITPEEPSMQGWYDPNLGEYIPNNHSNYFRYDITIPTEEAFIQTSNTIYWLDVSVETAFGQWGWKTTTNHWNDDAVWADIPVAQWQELYEPPLFEQSMDLAFIIDGPDEQEPEDFDWGDLPDSYNTLAANNGANHTISQTYILGATIDAETDGQPTAAANGDDVNNLADEDGITFTSSFVPGQSVTFNATASAVGQLDVWMDLNGNGTWDLPTEHVFSSGVIAGSNPLSFLLPIGTPAGQNYLRFRYTSSASAYASGAPLPTGNATDGEVEDYTVDVEELDWGDAPDTPYPTLATSSGAAHIILGGGLNPFLGSLVDPEPNGQPTVLADGDDLDVLYSSSGDDEDGVTWLTPFVPGAVAQVQVVVGGPGGSVDAWIDWNADGIWANPGEKIIGTGVLTPGSYTYLVPVPTHAAPATNTYARFRISSAGGLPPSGLAQDGEVEDYMLNIDDVQEIDWGDAPDTPYPTLRANNGAHHLIGNPLFLGNYADGEPDGQPTANADGDDIDLVYPSAGDDEDGINLISLLQPGGFASVDVIASIPGFIDAWIDFNNDGSWNQTGDRIFNNQPVGLGLTSLVFPVPLTASPGNPAYARFRLSGGTSAYPAGVSYTGLCMDGEVEDYEYYITPLAGGTDWGDAPDPSYPTLSASAGASHTIAAGVVLGATIDAETDGVPKTAADGDDTTGLDDEDGVAFTSQVVAGTNATVVVVGGVSGGLLDAWIDFNADGSWSDPSEHLWGGTAQTVNPGANNYSFTVPGLPAQALGPTYARFRISSAGGLLPTGAAADGEVEDYLVELYQPAPTNLIITNITVTLSNALAKVEWNAESNIIYKVQSSTNLLTNLWADVGGSLTGPVNWQTNSASPTSQFFRIIAPWTD
ncbi:MAG: hypothetical protein ISR85_05095 [Kiritimatiellales bacterium]|nr:hypothetical protein [Kiritimatiellota bacterium]MBL7012288.1 hypothetical protein [Kiritimatiellales bacterium]